MIDRRPGALLLTAAFFVIAYFAAVAAFRGAAMTFAVLAIPALVFVLTRPDLGIFLFTTLYSLLPSSEGITPAELASAGILGLLVFSWFFLVEFRGLSSYSPRSLVPVVALFYLWLALSLSVRIYHGGRVIEWARDMVPLANLALLLPVKDFFRERPQFRRLLTVFVVVLIVVNLRAAFHFLGLPFPVRMIMNNSTYHPVVLMLIGLALVASFRAASLLGVASVVTSLLFVIGTTNRTTLLAIVLATALFFVARRASGATIVIAAFALVAGYFVYLGVMEYRPETLEAKRVRLESLLATEGDLSYQNRMDEMIECWRLFTEHPVAGLGLGYPYHFWRHFIQGLGPGYLDTNFTHSDLMNLLAKTGGVGALLWMLVVGVLLIIGLDVIRKADRDDPDRDLAIGLTLSIFMAQVIGQSTPVMQNREGMYLFGIVAGLLIALHRQVTGAERTSEGQGSEEGARSEDGGDGA